MFAIQEGGALASLVDIPYGLDGADPASQTGAEIALHPTLPYLYLSNRGVGAIVVMEIVDPVSATIFQKQV